MSEPTPPCGHNFGTHPSGCWYVKAVDLAVDYGNQMIAAYRADLAARVRGIGHPCHEVCAGELHADCQCAAYVREQALAEIEKETR